MAIATISRPDLAAHREALRLSIPDIVAKLVELIGRKLTAYVGGVRDVRAVDRWTNGGELYKDAEQRLRFAYQLVRMLAEREDPKAIQSWEPRERSWWAVRCETWIWRRSGLPGRFFASDETNHI